MVDFTKHLATYDSSQVKSFVDHARGELRRIMRRKLSCNVSQCFVKLSTGLEVRYCGYDERKRLLVRTLRDIRNYVCIKENAIACRFALLDAISIRALSDCQLKK